MKKTYQHPATLVMNVDMQTLLEASQPGVGGTTNKEEDLLSSRRGGSAWDDDEE